MENFIITGMGGSGTRFLAETLNRSSWQVEHEARPKRARFDVVQKRLKRDKYGEVSGTLLLHVGALDVGKKAVIVRRPSDLLWSWSEHRGPEWEPNPVAFVKYGLRVIDDLIAAGMRAIYFEEMFNVEYLESLATWLGISDLKLTPGCVANKVNRKRVGIYKSFHETPVAEFWPLIRDYERRWYDHD